jgi:2-polyprenyl-3-methyl-5-hydroxy-6-metoxy-1,4-benzoquinol methylase
MTSDAHTARLPATLGGHACPVCGTAVRRAMDVGAFELFSCHRCGCWCSNALVRNAATSFAPDHYFRNSRADEPKWDALLDRLAAIGGQPRSVLDVGCGTGDFLARVAGRFPGLRQAGIELDPARAAEAQRANPAAEVRAGDAVQVLAGIGQRFDLITLWDVFEHVTQPAVLLRLLAARLEPGGHLFIQTIHEDSAVPRLGRLSYRLSGGLLRGVARRTHDAHHLVFFTRMGLARLARDEGLHIADLWFDRLALARMDGNPLLTRATAMLLTLENALGNGLFLNVLMRAAGARPGTAGERDGA